MKLTNTSIKARGFGLSGISVFYILIIYIAAMWAWLLLLIPLVHYFPFLKNNDWIAAIPCLLIVVLLVAHLLTSFYTVTLTEKTIVLSCLGFPLRKFSVDSLQSFCAVGNGREDVLCLSSRTIEEMALLEEQHLLHNFFTKYDVPLIKKKLDWKDVLAGKYLNRLRRSPRGIFRDKRTLFVSMDPVVQYQIHCLYSHLPYKNYTGITDKKVDLFLDKTTAPCLWMPIDSYFVEFQNNDIVLRTKKEIKRNIPLRNIKTIVRVDVFRPYNKHFPHHFPVLFLSVYTPKEMSNMIMQPEKDQILRAYRYAEREAKRWPTQKEDCCNLHYTAETVAQLRLLCKQAQWIDISDGWISDSP